MKKKFGLLAFLMIVGIFSIFTITKVNAAGWSSTLNLPYGVFYTGAMRQYGSGSHRISIQVDGFNTSSGSVRKSGSTTMEVELHDIATGYLFGHNIGTYTYATCHDVWMGTFDSGYRKYAFNSRIYNSSTGTYTNYDGVKSSHVYMYPLP